LTRLMSFAININMAQEQVKDSVSTIDNSKGQKILNEQAMQEDLLRKLPRLRIVPKDSIIDFHGRSRGKTLQDALVMIGRIGPGKKQFEITWSPIVLWPFGSEEPITIGGGKNIGIKGVEIAFPLKKTRIVTEENIQPFMPAIRTLYIQKMANQARSLGPEVFRQ